MNCFKLICFVAFLTSSVSHAKKTIADDMSLISSEKEINNQTTTFRNLKISLEGGDYFLMNASNAPEKVCAHYGFEAVILGETVNRNTPRSILKLSDDVFIAPGEFSDGDYIIATSGPTLDIVTCAKEVETVEFKIIAAKSTLRGNVLKYTGLELVVEGLPFKILASARSPEKICKYFKRGPMVDNEVIEVHGEQMVKLDDNSSFAAPGFFNYFWPTPDFYTMQASTIMNGPQLASVSCAL